MDSLTPEAIRAHYARKRREGGDRVVKEWTNRWPGYAVAIVHFAGEPCLVIKPVPHHDKAWSTCIPRSEIAEYVSPEGKPEMAAWKRFPDWLKFMGKEVSLHEMTKLGSILADTYPDFYAVRPDTLIIEPEGYGTVAIVNGETGERREMEV